MFTPSSVFVGVDEFDLLEWQADAVVTRLEEIQVQLELQDLPRDTVSHLEALRQSLSDQADRLLAKMDAALVDHPAQLSFWG